MRKHCKNNLQVFHTMNTVRMFLEDHAFDVVLSSTSHVCCPSDVSCFYSKG